MSLVKWGFIALFLLPVAGMVALLGIGVRGARAGVAMRACLRAIAALLRDLARVVA